MSGEIEKKGSPIPCDECYHNSEYALVSVEECQRRVRHGVASCREFEEWLEEHEGKWRRGDDTTRKQDAMVESLVCERNEALEKIKKVVALCAYTILEYQRKGFSEQGINSRGELVGIPVAAIRECLGLPAFEDADGLCIGGASVVGEGEGEGEFSRAEGSLGLPGPPEPPLPGKGVRKYPLVYFAESVKGLEGLVVRLEFPSWGGESAGVDLSVRLPADDMVAMEVSGRLEYLMDKRIPVKLTLWDDEGDK